MLQALRTVRSASPPERKIEINRPDDEYEKAADSMAAQVIRAPSSDFISPPPGPAHDFSRIGIHSPSTRHPSGAVSRAGVLRRQCSCGGTCAECQKENEGNESASLRRKEAGPESSIAGRIEAPASVHQVLRSPGQPLDRTTRAFMEPRFGYDFGKVRVHTDAEAARSAEQVNARAYAVDDHLVFAGGLFSPGSRAGTQLLAHELAHVVQAGGGTGGATLRRAPAGGTPPPPPSEAMLRVSIMDTLEAAKRTAVADLADAIVRGDQAYLSGLGLSSRQVTSLLNHDAQFSMTFGNAAETSLESAIRANPLLNQYVVRGPTGRVARGVGKPDWRVETPSEQHPGRPDDSGTGGRRSYRCGAGRRGAAGRNGTSKRPVILPTIGMLPWLRPVRIRLPGRLLRTNLLQPTLRIKPLRLMLRMRLLEAMLLTGLQRVTSRTRQLGGM